MSVSPVVSDSKFSIDAVLTALKSRANASRYAQAELLANLFFRRIVPEDIGLRDANGWAALIDGLSEFLHKRGSGKSEIRVFNPSIQTHGWESSHTIIQMINDDMPFLVDSVAMTLNQCQAQMHSIVHPIIIADRDPGGHLLGLAEEGSQGKGRAESLIHIEVDRRTDAEELLALAQAIEATLADVRACVADWKPMREQMLAIIEDMPTRVLPINDEARAEGQEFLRWAADNHFTFLGYREYEVVDSDDGDVLIAIEGSGKGILRGKNKISNPRRLRDLRARELPHSGSVDALILTKTSAHSTVHRPGYMDYIGVLKFDKNGRAIGEQRFLGLYTSSAYSRRPWDIPLVRDRYDRVMKNSGLREEGHGWKALRNILEVLPRDELFQSSTDELFSTAIGILHLQERQRTRIFVRQDRYGRFYSCLVFLPRDRFNTKVRKSIEELIKITFNSDQVDSTIHLSEATLARLHLVVRPRNQEIVEFDVAALEKSLTQIVKNWHDELSEILIQKHGEEQGLKLANRFGKALPVGYIEEITAELAAEDVEIAASLKGPEDIRLNLYSTQPDSGNLRFKLFRFGSPIPLSDALPMMENMGLRVISEHPYEMVLQNSSIFIQDFEVVPVVGDELNVATVREAFQNAFERIWRGEAESDGYNRLILSANMDWRQVMVIRAYCKYLLQVGVAFSQAYMEETFVRYPLHARLIVELFQARFDPERENASKTVVVANQKKLQRELEQLAGDEVWQAFSSRFTALIDAQGATRSEQIKATSRCVKSLLDRVASLDEDRILRSFIDVIQATLRTNFYQQNNGRWKDYLSLKFDANKVPDLPKPRPHREIFVFSPRVEGVHLRFGLVARGGLRWSDRREDFRTEVLGLVKAQMVKNTVIVPVGAKGGFFVKRSPVGGDRDAVLAEGVACYRMFINGLLDITDNLVAGAVKHPANVVRHDKDDPYLVVAADKGTATFSDIANAVSLEHGFWMGDAFASGGSQGYDHKKMGITAKGAWESVKRHFRAMGRDSQTQEFTCAGIGDMSGDVFGNGMLLSEKIKLVAAFDHRHIFLDPNPNAAETFVERDRMFKLPRSSWADYSENLISKGGGIYPRTAKTIALSAEVKQSLGIEGDVKELPPMELITAILKAPVDLLWNGGIGTYIKASTETHADVGDRANNPIRINGSELRCKVVGEGGNLGVTQRGRIEAAQNAVHLNTDFIDNSAGVDTSDHEVNIKILLNDVVANNQLDETGRNALLVQMTDEVEVLVLRDNYLQNQAISLLERLSVSRIGAKQHFIRVLESQGLLDRAIEYLPTDAEFADRKARGQGLTRPELSTLLSYSKIVLYQQLLDSDVPEDPHLSKELVRYFPTPLQEKYGENMQRHRLRREIIATVVTNSVVNRMGATFVLRMQEDTGETPGQISKAYSIAREILDVRALWAEIETLDGNVSGNAQTDALLRIWALMRHLTRWLLNLPGHKLEIANAVSRYAPAMEQLRAHLQDVMAESDRQVAFNDQQVWKGYGFPEELSRQLSLLPALASSLDIIDVALEQQKPVDEVAKVHYALGEALHLRWLLQRIEELTVEGRWHAHARGSLRDELLSQQRALVALILESTDSNTNGEALVSRWLSQDDPSLKFTLTMLADMRNQVNMDYATISVAVRRLAQMVQATLALKQ